MKLKYSDDEIKQDWYGTVVGNDMKMNCANSCSIFFVEFSQGNWSVQEGLVAHWLGNCRASHVQSLIEA